ncbi:MAG: hypothetical protein HN948_00635 [Clostridia bacterium]|jgi:xylulokinase|nr:hypothetical protein [Clostridia bacterium]MBT7121494.1 hypothetical protein [Clostridia bacterium]
MLFIGLDVGTAGCKASLVDERGNVLEYKYCEYSVETPREGYVEMDANLVWGAVSKALSGIGNKDVAAIGIATFGEAIIMMDDNDNVLAKSIFYSDIRGTEEVDDILAAMDRDEVQAITGLPITPMYSANKLLWIKKNQPDLYGKAKKMMLFGDFLAYMLTGERIVDFASASRTMLLDISQGTWSDKVSGALGIDTSLLSKPVMPGTTAGQLLPSVASSLGFSQKVKVVAGGHDQIMAALGSGVLKKGESVDGMGSAECITLALNREDITPKMYANNYCCEPYVFEDMFVTLAFNISSGTAIKWYRDAIEDVRAEEYAKRGESLYVQLGKECSKDISGVHFLPYVAGSGTPYMDSSTGAAFLGVRSSTRKPDLYRAVLEGVCFEMKVNIETLEQCGIVLDNTVAVGGGSESDLVMQIKADIWNREIRTVHSAQAGTTGVAILCSVATGAYASIEEAVGQMVRPGKTFVPNAQMVKQYEDKMQTYRRIYGALKSIQGD